METQTQTWESEGGAVLSETPEQPVRVLICTQIGPGKDYTAAFLLEIVRALQGAAGIHILVDGIPIPVELQALQENEVLLELPPAKEAWADLPAARTARAREAQRQAAIAGDWTHLYFHDSDTVPPADIITRLLAHQAPVATGIYNMRGRSDVAVPVAPVPYKRWPPAWPGLAGLHAKGGGLFSAAHFGMGCMLIRRDVLERVPFRSPEACFSGHIPEDVAWGADLAGIGGEVLVDTGVSCWHADADGSANRLVVGDPEATAVWTDTPHLVTNRFGEWQAGVPHYGLDDEALQSLGPGFIKGHYPRLAVEVRPTEEILTSWEK